MAKKKWTKADQEFEARVLENARRLRQLAEAGYAKLKPVQQARVRELVPRLRDGE